MMASIGGHSGGMGTVVTPLKRAKTRVVEYVYVPTADPKTVADISRAQYRINPLPVLGSIEWVNG